MFCARWGGIPWDVARREFLERGEFFGTVVGFAAVMRA